MVFRRVDDERGIRTHALSDYGIALHDDGDDVIKEILNVAP